MPVPGHPLKHLVQLRREVGGVQMAVPVGKGDGRYDVGGERRVGMPQLQIFAGSGGLLDPGAELVHLGPEEGF